MHSATILSSFALCRLRPHAAVALLFPSTLQVPCTQASLSQLGLCLLTATRLLLAAACAGPANSSSCRACKRFCMLGLTSPQHNKAACRQPKW